MNVALLLLPTVTSAFAVFCVSLLGLGIAGCASTGQPLVAERSPVFEQGATSYRVRPGDTLYSIAWRYGLHVGDLARYNRLRHPFTIFPEQRLELRAPASAAPSTTTRRLPRQVPVPPTPQPDALARQWTWPVVAAPIRDFRSTRRGYDYRLTMGTTVVAAAAGAVVYAGVGIGGFEDLIIVDHGGDHLSAYGFSGRQRVQEGQSIKAAQALADIQGVGPLDHSLHFEVRFRGRPKDPRQLIEP